MFKKFYSLTNAPIDYFNNLVSFMGNIGFLLTTIILFVKNPVTINLYNSTTNLPVILKLIIVLLSVLIIIYGFKRILKDSKFIVSSISYQNSLEKTNSDIENSSILNYKKIIPSQTLVEGITDEIMKKIKMEWDPRAYLLSITLDIWIRKEIIDPVITIKAHSDNRESTLTISTKGLKIPQEKINVRQIEHSTYSNPQKPFYENKYWRRFIIMSLERLEHVIAGKKVYISISSMLGLTRLYVDPSLIPQHTYQYFQIGKSISTDPSGQDIITNYL